MANGDVATERRMAAWVGKALLIQGKVVTVEQVAAALALQAEAGGRLGDHLVASGAIARDVLDQFLHRMPAEPANIAATGIDGADLLGILMKVIYVQHLETMRQFIDAIKFPYTLTLDLGDTGGGLCWSVRPALSAVSRAAG